MFCYCGNNPIVRADTNGHLWKQIKSFAKNTWNWVKNFTSRTFGAGATLMHQTTRNVKQYVPPVLNLLFSVETGIRVATTSNVFGNSNKPISVFAQGRSDNYLLSSAGVNMIISNFSIKGSLGLDNIGVRAAIKKGDTTSSISLVVDVSKLRVGLEGANTYAIDEHNFETSYWNLSVTGIGIIAFLVFSSTGQWIGNSSPQYA